jgi:hypothetical protein
MDDGLDTLPDDIEALKVALVVARAEVAAVRAQHSDDQALIGLAPVSWTGEVLGSGY